MSSPQSHVVSVIESACEGDLIQIGLYEGDLIQIGLYLFEPNNLAYLALIEVIALSHLN